MSKLYAERDIENLDTYCQHISAMTKEDLRSKSDIAAELAFRDEKNKLLREALEEILYNHRLASFDIESVTTKALEATK